MTEALLLAPAFIAGILLGIFFFGGLWWTVRKGVAAKHIALWFFGSLLLRSGVVMLGFYWMMGDSWQRMLAGLLGFVIARVVVTQLTRRAKFQESKADLPSPCRELIGGEAPSQIVK